jgi:hypothetical protein
MSTVGVVWLSLSWSWLSSKEREKRDPTQQQRSDRQITSLFTATAAVANVAIMTDISCVIITNNESHSFHVVTFVIRRTVGSLVRLELDGWVIPFKYQILSTSYGLSWRK